MATWHPSALLRAPDKDRRDEMQAMFLADLQLVSKFLHNGKAKQRKPK